MARDRKQICGETQTKDIVKRRKITTASAKQKGRLLQIWTCQRVSELLDIPYGKDELIASREASQTGTDVRLIGEARSRFPWSIECKNQETWSVAEWIKQAKANQMEGTDWLLVLKKSRMNPIIVMDAEVFFELFRGRGKEGEKDK